MRVSLNQFDVTETVFTGHGSLALMTGISGGAAVRYLFLYDGAGPIPPATPATDPAVLQVIAVGPGANFSYAPTAQFPNIGTALTWGVSDTLATFTASADSFFVHTEAQGP